MQPALDVVQVRLDNTAGTAERIRSAGLSRSQTGAPAHNENCCAQPQRTVLCRTDDARLVSLDFVREGLFLHESLTNHRQTTARPNPNVPLGILRDGADAVPGETFELGKILETSVLDLADSAIGAHPNTAVPRFADGPRAIMRQPITGGVRHDFARGPARTSRTSWSIPRWWPGRSILKGCFLQRFTANLVSTTLPCSPPCGWKLLLMTQVRSVRVASSAGRSCGKRDAAATRSRDGLRYEDSGKRPPSILDAHRGHEPRHWSAEIQLRADLEVCAPRSTGSPQFILERSASLNQGGNNLSPRSNRTGTSGGGEPSPPRFRAYCHGSRIAHRCP